MSSRFTNSFSVAYRYPVVFTHDAFAPTNALVAMVLGEVLGELAPTPCLVLVDDGLAAADPGLAGRIAAYCLAHADLLDLRQAPVLVPGGEAAKQGWGVVNRTLQLALAHGLCRHSAVFAVGGGAMLDAVGLGAALFHRGVRLLRFPSTVLSQCDSGVGVKNGIDLDGVKNLAGVFAPPAAVVNDLQLLLSLSERDWIAGVAEAFKVAVIKDAAFLEWLIDRAARLRGRDGVAMEELVHRCAARHCEHIVGGGDPFESGNARPLDFGHWAAHKLESLTHFALRHGEAVAIGMGLDLLYAAELGLIGRQEAERVILALARCGLPVWHPQLERRNLAGALPLLDGIDEFRQHLGGTLHVTLPAPLGRCREVTELDRATVLAAMAALKDCARRAGGELAGTRAG
jgi:3-dehydroquinate synthase